MLTDRATRTLPVAASLFITDMGVDWGRVMAMASLIAIAPLILPLWRRGKLLPDSRR